MGRSVNVWMSLTACLAVVLLVGVPIWVAGCGTSAVPTASPAAGTMPGIGGNQRPSFTFVTPDRGVTLSVGTIYLISWIDNDPDDDAVIDLVLDPDTNNDSGNELLILGGRSEDADAIGDDEFEFDTSRVPVGDYYLRAVVNDGVNSQVLVNAPGEFDIVPEGTASLNQPPQITVLEPTANRSVANGDLLVIEWDDEDVDDDAFVYVTLDRDNIPNNDDVQDATDPGNILLTQTTENPDPAVPPEPEDPNANADRYLLTVDVTAQEVRPEGLPYYVKVTLIDGANPPVHAYAPGEVYVLSQAQPEFTSGLPDPVDLGRVGTVVSGVTFQGFNAGAWLGSCGRTLSDFDADGADDFALVGRFGTPQNVGPLGQAFIIYGLPPVGEEAFPGIGVEPDRGERFGGRISVNQIASTISGVLLQGPHDVHTQNYNTEALELSEQNVFTGGVNMGITDVGFMPDISGDGRPEVVFGLPFVDGVLQARDDDVGDGPVDLVFASDDPLFVGEPLRFWVQDSFGSTGGELASNCLENILTVTATQSVVIEVELRPGLLAELVHVLTLPQAEAEVSAATLTLMLASDNSQLQVEVVGYRYNPTYAGACSALPNEADIEGQVDLTVNGDALTDVSADVGDMVSAMVDDIVSDIVSDPDLVPGVTSASLVFTIESTGGTGTAAFQAIDIPGDPEAQNLAGPRLSLTLTSAGGFVPGAYDDRQVNNYTTTANDDPDDENDFESLEYGFQPERTGCAVMLYSSNRGVFAAAEATRLENTSINLEYVGQEPFPTLTYGAQDNVYEGGARMAGARFQAALFDWYNEFFSKLYDQGPLFGLYGHTVDSLPSFNASDPLDAFVVSAPLNESLVAGLTELEEDIGRAPSHLRSRLTESGVHVFLGQEFGGFGEDRAAGSETRRGAASNSVIPYLEAGSATPGSEEDAARDMIIPERQFEVFGEHPQDGLGYARFAGDYNDDGIPDIAMGAPRADVEIDAVTTLSEAGKTYVLFGTSDPGGLAEQGVHLSELVPVGSVVGLCVYGEHDGDHLGMLQGLQQDFNQDGADDVVIASGDYDWAGEEDTGAVAILLGGKISSATPAASGYAAFSEIGSQTFPGLVFYGANSGDRAGGGVDDGYVITCHGASGSGFYARTRSEPPPYPIVTTGADFNNDGFGDLLIAAPGAIGYSNGLPRKGVVYLIYGGRLVWDSATPQNNRFSLDQVGTSAVPGMVFVSPFAPPPDADAAAPTSVAFIGDVNRDGFGDILVGNPLADWVGLNPANRRPDAGEAYLIYGNNVGCNNRANWDTEGCFGE